MEKSSESSSDSDSNSSTSWVFVYDSSGTVQKSTNTFHLDCSREPIQELTEQDLLSASSDIESDTDGISVISESEIPNDDLCANVQATVCNSGVEEVEETPTISDDSCETVTETAVVQPENERVAKFELKKFFKPCNILGISFVLTAIFLASYNQILTKLSVKDAGDVQENNDVSYDKINVMVGDNTKKMYGAKRGLDKDMEQIVDMTLSCTYGDKTRNEFRDREIKRCVQKQYKSKRMACLKKNGLTDEEALKWSEIPNEIVNKMEETISENVIENIDDDNNNYKESKYKYNKQNKNKNEAFYNTEGETGTSRNFKKKGKVGKSERNIDNEYKQKNKKKYNSEEKFKGGSKQESKYKGQIHVKKPYKHQKDKKENKDYKNKIHNYVDKKHDSKYNSYNKKYNKNQANKVFVNFNDKDKRHYKDKAIDSNKNSSEMKYNEATSKTNPKNDQLFVMQQKEKNNTNGEWYTNLHKARTQIRKQEHVSDWVFDRAYIRNKKRNKAQWYFKWMNVREQLRYKQSYRPYSS